MKHLTTIAVYTAVFAVVFYERALIPFAQSAQKNLLKVKGVLAEELSTDKADATAVVITEAAPKAARKKRTRKTPALAVAD